MAIKTDAYYSPNDPELRVLGAVQTLNRWRHEGIGPPYLKFGSRVLYSGRDLLAWLEAHRVERPDDPTNSEARGSLS